jgi:hypothetical protein
MFRLKMKTIIMAIAVVLVVLLLAVPNTTVTKTEAADHAEAPLVASDPSADIADVFAFLDPNDNTKVILAMDVEGFVVPAELLNLSGFSPDVVYRFEIENTGDAKPDMHIDVTFDPIYSRRAPQIAHIVLPDGSSFDGRTTVQSQRGNVNDISTANPFLITSDPNSGVSFYAGICDDPFFFDIIGFNRYVIKLVDRNPTAKTDLTRGRDSFAGFNAHMIALSVPASMLKGASTSIIGVNGVTLRHSNVMFQPGGGTIAKNPKANDLVQIDRMATPVINTVLILALQRKNEYNATPVEDSAKFDPDLIDTFRFIRTSDEAANAVRGLVTKNGDYLRLDLSKPNNSLGVGENLATPNFAGFPNGRRPGDDTIDTILFFVNSEQPLGDSVNSNDVPFGTTFPFFAPPHQPPRPGDDDGTQF